jgi:hypothetical protein
MTTASGERYDAKGWTAAVQTDLRSEFGGVRFGRSYRPTYAIVTAGEKSAVVKINDVGPLAAGRVIDLSEEVMRYFDPSLQQGVLAHVTVLPLLGGHWRAGPIAGVPPSIMAGDCLPEL